MERFARTERLIGKAAVERLKQARVALFGVGGVGSYTAEALARSGVGSLTLIDADCVDITNINRQLIALSSTIGQPKVEVMRQRILDINPSADVAAHQVFYGADTASLVDFSQFDYIIDAIDTVTAKLLLVEHARDAGVPILSAMGAGNKLDASRFEITDLSKTTVCPLARVMRIELKKRDIRHVKVLYSKEEPVLPQDDAPRVPASIAFVPSVAGLLIAGAVIQDLCGITQPILPH